MPTNPDDRVSRNPLGPKGPPPVPGQPAPMESLPSLARGNSEGGGLSSLAQAAREKHLKSARGTLIAIGILTIVFNIAAIFIVKGQLDDELRKGGFDRANLPVEVQAQIAITYATVAGFIFLGVVFVVLGFLVRSFPVPCTVAGLVLYILGFVISGALDPRQFAQVGAAIVIKVVIVVALFKAVQAAIAYQRSSAEVVPEFD